MSLKRMGRDSLELVQAHWSAKNLATMAGARSMGWFSALPRGGLGAGGRHE